jgi:hypothetical protein
MEKTHLLNIVGGDWTEVDLQLTHYGMGWLLDL